MELLPEQETNQTLPDDDLTAAARQLEALPMDTIPDPAPLPPGSRMPFQPNPLFVGREADLRFLAKTLKAERIASMGQITALTGMGGLGKSQLAVEFAHRYGQYFTGGVFWLDFTAPTGVPAEIAACGGRVYLNLASDFDQLELDTQARLVWAAWQSPLPRLLIFDDCEDENLVAWWRPPVGGCRVLLTSRRADWDPTLGIKTRRLGVLPRSESINLLRKFRADLSKRDPHVKAIAAQLGDLPLALHLAGSFLKQYEHEVTPAEYLAELQTGPLLTHESLQGLEANLSPTRHVLNVQRTFALSYDRLNPANPDDALALALLGRAAYFALGEPIPRGLLLATLELPDESVRRQAARAFNRLAALGLLEVKNAETVSLHRLLAEFGRNQTNQAEAQTAVELTLLHEARRLNQSGYPATLLNWQVHLRAVTEAAQKRGDENGANLGNELGYHLALLGDLTAAQTCFEQALAIQEKILAPDHPDLATSLNNLGFLLQTRRNFAQARLYLERALNIREKILESDHPTIALSLNNLGSLYQQLGHFSAARTCFERALLIREKRQGPEHPDTATCLNNLGFLLGAMGDLTTARSYYERALAIYEKNLGLEHPHTALSLNNLGSLLRAMGNPSQARPLYERALAIREKILGPDHLDTARSLNNLGSLLQAMGDRDAARTYIEPALAIFQQKLGSDHPYTKIAIDNLADLEGSQK